MDTWVVFIVLGAVSGLIAGLLGLGGGIILVPGLNTTFLAHPETAPYAMQLAIGTSLATMFFTAIASGLAHHHQKSVDWNMAWWLSLGLIPGTMLGAGLVTVLDQNWLAQLFGSYLLLLAAYMLLKRNRPPNTQTEITPSMPMVVGSGVAFGSISAMLGIGGGIMMVPFLVSQGIVLRRSIGTSAVAAGAIALVGGITLASYQGHSVPSSLGFVYLPALSFCVAGAFLFAPIGSRLAHLLPVKRLRFIFAVLMLVMGIELWVEQLT